MTAARRFPATTSFGIALRMAWCANRPAMAIGLLVTVATGIAPVAAAWLMRDILDTLAYAARHPQLPLLVVVLAVTGGVQAMLPYLSQYLSAQSSRAVERHASAMLFAAVGRLSGLRRLEDPGYRDNLNMAQQAGQSGPGQIVSSLASMTQAAVTLAGFLGTLLLISPLMAAILTVAAIPEVIIELRFARQRATLMRGMSHAERRQAFYADLLSSYAAATEIRLFRLAPFFLTRMLEELTTIQRASQRADRRSLAGYSVLGGLSTAIAGLCLWWAVTAAAGGRLTIGDVTVFTAAILTVTSSLSAIIASAALAYQAALLFGCYQDVVTEEPDLPSPARPAPAGPLRHGIEVSDVWFRYGPEQPWVLCGVSLFIPHGQTLALVGLNGAGKSTLVKLLCRFYDPDRGQIRWDGTDLREFDVAELRERISGVFQDFMRYELSASENIAVGELERAGQQPLLTAAAGRAGIHDVITARAVPRGSCR